VNNAANPFGSARFAEPSEIKRAGSFRQNPDSLFLGFDGDRPIWYDGMGGLVTVAGARSGKLRDVLAYNVCSGVHAGAILALDVKCEFASISQDQTADRKFAGYWNPAGRHGLPQDRINPVDHIHAYSRDMPGDIKKLAMLLIEKTGSPQGVYFEGRGREFLEAICKAIVARDRVLTLPAIYRAVKGIPARSDESLELEFEMSESKDEEIKGVQREIDEGRKTDSGGFQGIMGELQKSVACLSDPVVRESVSPPYTMSLADLMDETRAWQLYLMPPADSLGVCAPIIKCIFWAGRTYKSRNPAAPRQTWIIDEAAQLGAFPALVDLFSISAGEGIRPWAIFQSVDQMDAIGPKAKSIILSSAAVRQFFGVRDLETATTLSKMLGEETLRYEDEMRTEQARHAREQAFHQLVNGGDPLDAHARIVHAERQAGTDMLRARALMTPNEILHMPRDKQLLFVDEVPAPIYADRRPYYEQRFMAGRYHPNPYYPPADRVRVKTMFGHGWKTVVREPVPDEFAHYPQYRDGYWSKVR